MTWAGRALTSTSPSISRTWLRFPVGENYAYSNLGIDLAGYILQVRSGLPFPDYVRTRLLEPLGMDRTTCDPARIAREDNRAVGHTAPLRRLPLYIPIVPSGGVYTSARDLAEFVRFHLNSGRAGGRQLLAESRLAQMYAVPEPGMSPDGGYALGIGRFLRRGTYGYGHGGGGFGFLSDMYWYPELGMGAVVLTNSTGHQLQGQLVFQLLDTLLDEPGTVYHRRLADLPPLNPAEYTTPLDRQARLTWNVQAHLLALAPRVTAARQAAWRGIYRELPLPGLGPGRRDDPGQAARRRAYPGRAGADRGPAGLFFTLDGEALDLRGQVPTWRNIKLTRIAITPWQWIFLPWASCSCRFYYYCGPFSSAAGGLRLFQRERASDARPSSSPA